MSRADIMAGKAYVSLYVKQDPLTRGLQQAQAKMQKFGSEVMQAGAKIAAFGAVVASPIAFATAKFAEFDDAIRATGAVSQATAAELKSLSDTAKQLGATTSFTAVEVANLMTELGRAGFKPDQINAMTGAVMDLARATKTDATLASGIMAATIRQFGLEATDAARAADVLTKAANSTFNTVEGLGESLKYAGPVARELGLSLEDTVAILGTLGNVGIQGSEAGTAIRRLGVISAATGEKLQQIFGISNVDAAGNLKPLVQILGEIGRSLDGMQVAEKTAKMNEAFGLLGITSATVLSRTAGDTAALAEALKNAEGTAAKAAKTMDSGLGGAFRIVMSAAEGLQLAIGQALEGSIQSLTNSITTAIGRATQWVDANREIVVALTAVTAAVVSVGSALVATGVAIKIAAMGVGVLATGFAAVRTTLGIVTGAVRLFRAATVGLATLMQGAFTAATVSSTAAVTSLAVAQSASIVVLAPYTTATVAAANAQALLGIASGATTTALIAAANAQALLGIASGATTTALIAATGAISAATAGNTGLIATTAAASTGMIVMSGSAATATAGVGAVATAAGIMGAAFTAASGAISAAWTVLLAPVAPFIAVAGVAIAAVTALGAAAAYATLKGIDFSGAWSAIKTTLSDVMSIAAKVGGVLMKALGEGDYAVAFQAAAAGVKLALAKMLESMGALWTTFWNNAWSLASKFFSNLIRVGSTVVGKLAEAIRNPMKGIRISDIAKTLGNLSIPFDFDTKGMAAEATAELDRLEAKLEARRKARESQQAAGQQGGAGAIGGAGGQAGNGQPFGDQTIAQIDGAEAAAEESRAAFDRETEAIQQQIIALREGEEAAERFRLAKQGLTDDEINQVIQLRREQQRLQQEKEAAEERMRRKKEEFDSLKNSVRSGVASSATFSASSLLAMGTGSNDAQVKAVNAVKTTIEQQSKMLAEQGQQFIAAVKGLQMVHA